MKRSSPYILVVDDEVDTCRNLSDILTDLDYRVDVAHDGPSALELVRRNPYDVALLDLRMPGMDGLTLFREVKKIRSGMVAIVVTAYASSATADDARSAGAWQIVSKPIDFPKLSKLVDEALGQPLIMVVDDDPDLCANLWDLLRERGYRVSIAHDEVRASQLLKDTTFEVVLIDMKLPAGDGSTVFRLVRGANPDTHTILITGQQPETAALVQRVIVEGADAVCYKPFDIARLLTTLEQLSRPTSR